MDTRPLLQQDELTGLVENLVRISSPSGGEAAMQSFIGNWFEEAGLSCRLERVDDGLQNLVVRVDGHGPGRTLFLGGHCDTVGATDGWQSEPLVPRVDDHRLYGLGALDMKGGLAAAMMAVRTLSRQRRDWSGRLIFAALADEECASRGATGFLRDAEPIDAALMCEPHFSKIGTGAIGKVNLRVDVTGTSAHASTPQYGVNAVTEAARFLVAFDAIDRQSHPEFGSASHCVLTMRTGDGRYEIRVPDRCEILINWHFMPEETPQDAVHQIRDLCRDLGSKAEFSVTTVEPAYESFLLDKDDQVIAQLKASIASVTGREVKTEFCSGVSDANLFAGHGGIPTLLFGPGGEGMHAANEWVDLNDVAHCRDIYTAFALRFLKPDQTDNRP